MSDDRPRGDRRANAVDLHVGARVRLRRKQLGLSQDRLADALGLTFQQVQKYERGANRISASKLFETAAFLKAPILWFFEGLGGTGEAAGVAESNEDSFQELVLTPEDAELLTAFKRIRNRRMRRTVVDLVREMADQDESERPAP